MVKVMATGFLVGLIWLVSSPAFSQGKLGVVDLQKALNSSKAGKEAKAIFGKKLESAQKLVDAKEEELKKLQVDLERQGLLLSVDARAAKTKEFEAKRRDFERYVKDSREELALEEKQLRDRILEELEKVVQKVGKEKGYTLIFERYQSGIFYAGEALDLTDQVIAAYDAQKK